MRIWTFRDELKKHEPSRVDNRLLGGAFGCPSDYFECTSSYDPNLCSPMLAIRCRACWSKPYAQERWRPNE